MIDLNKYPTILQEIHKAQLARSKGKEGQARVCARRAAGLVIKEYYSRRNIPIPASSAYELLRHFTTLPGIPSPARQNAMNLTMRVSESFQLPSQIDLIAEAISLCETILT